MITNKNFGYVLDFFDIITSWLWNYFSSLNGVVFAFFVTPFIVSAICIAIDFFFDIRDDFTEFSRYHDYASNFKGFIRYTKYKQGRTDMDDIYKKSKEHADYKHNLRMEEMKTFRQNENLRHQHKIEEQNLFNKVYSSPKHKDKKKVNLDIEVED